MSRNFTTLKNAGDFRFMIRAFSMSRFNSSDSNLIFGGIFKTFMQSSRISTRILTAHDLSVLIYNGFIDLRKCQYLSQEI